MPSIYLLEKEFYELCITDEVLCEIKELEEFEVSMNLYLKIVERSNKEKIESTINPYVWHLYKKEELIKVLDSLLQSETVVGTIFRKDIEIKKVKQFINKPDYYGVMFTDFI